MAKHTPGPWHVSKQQDGRSMVVYGADDSVVARVCFLNRNDNARLIAAAPLMFEALQALDKEMLKRQDWPYGIELSLQLVTALTVAGGAAT